MAGYEASAVGTEKPRPFHLAGAVAAVLSGSVVTWLAREANDVAVLTNLPVLILLGLLAAAFLGAAFAARTIAAPPFPAVLLAFAVGLLSPAIVAGVVVLPLAPIAILFSPIAWPITMPAALGWLVLVRWPRTRTRLDRPGFAFVALALSGVLLGLRYTQPFESTGPGGGSCIAFPGESIETIAWSPDGEWLGIGSERSYAEGHVRVLRASTGDVLELAHGDTVQAAWGLAVGPAGEISYLVVDVFTAETDPLHGAAIWVAAPGVPAQKVAALPTAAVSRITWTPDGVGGLLMLDPRTHREIQRPVWVRTSGDVAELVPMTDAEAATPAMATLLESYQESIRLNVDGVVREIQWPPDATGSIVVSPDGTQLIFEAWRLTAAGEREYDHLVAQSVATGQRAVLLEAQGWEARVAGDRLAYIESAAFTDNRLCVVDLPAT
jgi:hypothetical protein